MSKVMLFSMFLLVICWTTTSAEAANSIKGVVWASGAQAIGAEIVATNASTGETLRTKTELVYVGGWYQSGYEFPNCPRGVYRIEARFWNGRRYEFGRTTSVDFRRTDFGKAVRIIYVR